ncbi:MAG: ABC-type transport auxiliary lipoprotein family protein [Betaproteobacteria bacterium]
MRFFAASVLLLAACAPFGETKQAHRYYVLEPKSEAVPLPVRLGSVTASSFYDTEAIAYSRSPGTRGYYQLNSWTEPPARRIGELLARQVTDKGPVLNLHLIEMYHDAASAPGTVRISMAAEISGKGRKVFSSSVPAAAFDAAGAVKGFNEAAGAMMQEMATWIRSD